MLAILNFFLELCLLRRAPQDLPASQALFILVVGVGVLGSLLLAVTAGDSFGNGLLQSVLDLAFMLAVLQVALRVLGKPQRLLQTATALVGTDTLIGFFALLPLSLAVGADEQSARLVAAGLLFLALVVWSVLVSAHIVRHAFDISLMQGVFVAIAYDVLAFVLIGGMVQSLG